MSTNDTQSTTAGSVKSALGEISRSLASPSQSKGSREHWRAEIRPKRGVWRNCGSRVLRNFDLIDVNGASAGNKKFSRDHVCRVSSYTRIRLSVVIWGT